MCLYKYSQGLHAPMHAHVYVGALHVWHTCMHMWVFMLYTGREAREDYQMIDFIVLCLVFLRQGLSGNLELDW